MPGKKLQLKRWRRRLLWIITSIAALAVGIYIWDYFSPGLIGIEPDKTLYPVRGIDISSHNGDVDFEAMATDSIDFVLLKATEGSAFKDTKFHRNYLMAKRAGLHIGAYHFFRFDASGYMQALNFMHSIRGKELNMPVVIDVEEWTNPSNLTTATIVTRLKELISELEANGYKVMLYTNKDGYDRFIAGNFERYPLWICDLRRVPDKEWHLWQYTHRGNVAGIDGNVDINTFNGTREQWLEWIDENHSRQ